MDPQQLAKQVFDFNKAVFERFCSTGVAMQDNVEKMFNAWINKNNIPEEGKKTMIEWVNSCKQCRDEFKKNIDEGYQNIEKYLADSMK